MSCFIHVWSGWHSNWPWVGKVCQPIWLFDAIMWIKSSWDLLQQSTIQKCFAKCGSCWWTSNSSGTTSAISTVTIELKMKIFECQMPLKSFRWKCMYNVHVFECIKIAVVHKINACVTKHIESNFHKSTLYIIMFYIYVQSLYMYRT